ncbi:hypothetical protein [Kitasatospora aureofaciens]|uniref:hypothetical protein n=1 Tax=Kitasatospora aureofaciens TaxID=1894 RepID=UPI00052425CD|nr:hypothetical protein [Kitasatospora aureofaciens]
MVSFKELHEADFSGVSDAAEAWAGVAKALTSLDGRVTKDLTSTAQRAGWKGDAADEATKVMQGIDGDFKQASAVATALAAIMKTAAEDFAAARRDLDTALHDAQTQDLTVSADGTVSWSLPKGSRNDPDSDKLAKDLDAKAKAISERLAKAVEKATTADQRATADLQSDIGTSTTAFNPTPGGGGPVADAKRASDLMSKGGSLSDDQLKQLQTLLAANAENKDFSTTLLNGLNYGGKTGPEALLEYSKVYGDLAHGNHNAKGYQDVYGGLSVALAAATRDGGMGKDWEDGLLAAARRPGGSAAGWNDNYPALTALMGGGGKYDKAFLVKVGNDLVDYERNSETKGDDLWGPNWSLKAGGTGDPLAPLMKQIKSDPAAAGEFLDPSRNKNLTYLLKDRSWPNQDLEGKLSADDLRNSSHGMFGQVLEAAATGRDPDSSQPPVRPHDATMTRIMDTALSTLGGDKAGNENGLAAPLRRPMADMIADYAADTHDILSKDLPSPSEPGGLNATREQLLRVIRGTAEDPEAYSLIHLSETREVARQMSEYGPDAFKDVNGRPDPKFEGFVNQASKAFGALDAVQADTITDHKSDEQFKVNWKAKMDYHYIGTLANMLPGTDWLPVGDIAQRYVDVATSDWANKVNAAIDTKAQGDLSSLYTTGQSQMQVMLQRKAADMGVPSRDVLLGQLTDSANVHYYTSITQAHNAAFGKG